MDRNGSTFLLTLAGTICWPVCFWWMYRISTKQNYLLDQLRGQGKRIEKLSQVEHDLIKEVHPQVGEIKEGMEEMMAAVKENTESNITATKVEKRWVDGGLKRALGRYLRRGPKSIVKKP
jgi:sensor histidine kinase YesM